MSSKHIRKYFQKYYIFFSSATALIILVACSTTKKIPAGEYLLTKNNFTYTDTREYSDELPDYVSQTPNKKQLFLFPIGLWFYNMTNPKYDTVLTEYMTYPAEARNRKLRDSLFTKAGHPEYKGKSLFKERILHNFGTAPVILSEAKTETSADNIRKRLVYRGYWDADVNYKQKLDSAAKKAQVEYIITQKDPTYISEYYYKIPDSAIKSYYQKTIEKTHLRKGDILDQTVLESEVDRITDNMRNEGYYEFNGDNDEVYFTADTLQSRKQVPLILEIHKDSADSPYKKTTIGNLKLFVVNNVKDTVDVIKDSLRGIRFYKQDEQYKTGALWRPIVLRTGELYKQSNLDLTKRNITSMNNFNLIKYEEEIRKGTDSILDVSYYLAPLEKYEFRIANDLTYSQILNFGISPTIDLTTRNIFGGAENLTTSLSGVFGSVKDTKNTDKRAIAYEISAQGNINIPRLLVPFRYWKLIPKRYSPTTTINLGTSIQNNIGLGKISFNAGLNYFANVNDIITHKLSLFNTQISLTRNKDKYYDFFPNDKEIRDEIFQTYSEDLYQQFENGQISSDELTDKILVDYDFQNGLSGDNLDLYNSFLQSLYNKDRQTQDVIISSFIYNFIYNEIGKKQYTNPFYFNAKVEIAGNLLGLFSKNTSVKNSFGNEERTLFGVTYSQFIKFDFDIRKYFQFFGNHTLVLRQFIGLGIPHGNSTSMPFVRSYFNGGSNDIRAWRVFGGLGPADSQLDERVRSYVMENMKLTTNIEYRVPFTSMFEGAAFIDAGNIWNLNNDDLGDQFKFKKFISQMGVGTGLGLRINVAYITLRLDAAYKVYDPNKPSGERWAISKWQPLKPVINFAFGYPF